jgi:A/G-specific adenine glycosylase
VTRPAAARSGAVAATDGQRTALEPTRLDAFRRSVLGWYRREGRRFPFRGPTDPYLVLVSETILQQTQVSRGGPAWERFIARFQTVEALAASSPADVIRAWHGLGYNRRAINLRRAAIMVVEDLGGRFPRDVAGLERLPGVGPYTARAVASIAYGLPVGAVDTNVRRVLGRVFAGEVAPSERGLQDLADVLAQVERPGDWTAAMIDLGSTVCLPRSPRCDVCPVAGVCDSARPTPPGSAAPDRWSAGPGRPYPARLESTPAIPFERTNRWLRGRVLDLLRAVEGDGWLVLDDPIGTHDRAAVKAALRALAGEGLIELAPDDDTAEGTRATVRARLPPA